MVHIYTDGACRGNPGPGGYGVVVLDGDIVRHKFCEESEEDTTNNREEMKAILHAFEWAASNVNPTETVIIYSDSAYCVNMINDWIWNWAKNGWKNSKKKEVENIDLVKELYEYISKDFFNCQVVKVKGHAGDAGNELADALATFDGKKYFKTLYAHNLVEKLLY